MSEIHLRLVLHKIASRLSSSNMSSTGVGEGHKKKQIYQRRERPNPRDYCSHCGPSASSVWKGAAPVITYTVPTGLHQWLVIAV